MGKVNRAKVIAAANKYLQKGDYKRAVREYEKILKEDPSDIRTKLRVADLYLKLGEKERGIAAYEEVADFYASQGFLLKAVAVYKQVQKHKPKDISVHLALAGLYHQLGLINDALKQYREAIALQAEAGLTLDRLMTARKMLDLDPENVRLRVHLAEEFAAEGMIGEAVREFRVAAEALKKAGKTDEYVKVAERLLYHQPDDYEVSRDLAAIYMEKGDALRALMRLQVCYKARPNDPEVLDLLAQVFESIGQPQKAVAVLKALADVHDRAGLIRERDETYKRILKLQPQDETARRALQFQMGEEVPREAELVFEQSHGAIVEAHPLPSEEVPIDLLEEDTSPEIKVPQEEGSGPSEEETSAPVSLDFEPTLKTEVPPQEEISQEVALDFEPTIVDRQLPLDMETTPSPIGVDLTLVPEEFQEDIQNLEFLIDANLLDDARDLLEEIRKQAGDLPILARYEALLRR